MTTMVGALLVFAGLGCAPRTLTITLASDYINTQMHTHRPNCEERTGERLEVDIVCVTPKDLENPANARLSPDGNITSDVWFESRPSHSNIAAMGAFVIPSNRVFHLTDRQSNYGKYKGSRLEGAKGGRRTVEVTGIKFPTKYLYSNDSVIYVFPKFIDADGHYLSVPPAKFHSPGDYRKKLFVEIGVEDPCGAAHQYIKNTTQRRRGRD